MRVPRSVLDDLGAEFTKIVAPTSLCMAATLAVVRILNPLGKSDRRAVWLAQVYPEEVSRAAGGLATAAVAAVEGGQAPTNTDTGPSRLRREGGAHKDRAKQSECLPPGRSVVRNQPPWGAP